MRIKNPEVMQAICSYVDRYYREKHTTPSTSEMAIIMCLMASIQSRQESFAMAGRIFLYDVKCFMACPSWMRPFCLPSRQGHLPS